MYLYETRHKNSWESKQRGQLTNDDDEEMVSYLIIGLDHYHYHFQLRDRWMFSQIDKNISITCMTMS